MGAGNALFDLHEKFTADPWNLFQRSADCQILHLYPALDRLSASNQFELGVELISQSRQVIFSLSC